MAGMPLFRALIVAIAVALLVMVPWAARRAINPNDARGHQL
jgi:hypothetical protein